MIQIRPVSDLRNKFPEIETLVNSGNPVYLTKNGYGAMVVLSLEEYASLTDNIEMKLDEADRQAYDNNLSIDKVIARGKQSTAYLENLYRANKNNQVYIDFKGVDIYGRALGVIYFDKLNVNEDLQKNGGCMIYNYE